MEIPPTPPDIPGARDVGYRDLYLALLISLEANSPGVATPTFYGHLRRKVEDREIEGARSRSPDLARSRDVGSGDLDLALRGPGESKSMGSDRPCSTSAKNETQGPNMEGDYYFYVDYKKLDLEVGGGEI